MDEELCRSGGQGLLLSHSLIWFLLESSAVVAKKKADSKDGVSEVQMQSSSDICFLSINQVKVLLSK